MTATHEVDTLASLPGTSNATSRCVFRPFSGRSDLAQLVADIRRLAERKGCTASQWCIAWVAAQGEDTIPLPGAPSLALLSAADKRTGTKSVRYLEENWAARNVSLSQTELEEAKSMLDAVQVGGSRYSEHMLAGCEL